MDVHFSIRPIMIAGITYSIVRGHVSAVIVAVVAAIPKSSRNAVVNPGLGKFQSF